MRSAQKGPEGKITASGVSRAADEQPAALRSRSSKALVLYFGLESAECSQSPVDHVPIDPGL